MTLALPTDRLLHERQLVAAGCRRLAGVDEAGRGPLAGPVVAAAVVFPSDWLGTAFPEELRDLNDSKQLSPARRERFFERLVRDPAIHHSVVAVGPGDIDRLNILRATHQAMALALGRLVPPPDHVLVDGLFVPALGQAQTALVQGDARSYSIAAASVIAKVTRDRLMLQAAREYPAYGFARHKGYPTPAHLEALRRHGPSPIHRRSFLPVRLAQGELFAAAEAGARTQVSRLRPAGP